MITLPMKLANLLRPELISLSLKETTGPEAIREVTQLLRSNPEIKNVDTILQDILKREQIESTVLDYGVAFPHARIDYVKNLILAIGRSTSGIQFTNGKQPVHFVFLIITPKAKVTEYLALVGTLARLSKDKAVQEQLTTATSQREFVKIFVNAEEKMQAG